MPAAASAVLGHGQLACQGHLAVAGRGGPDIRQRLPGDPLHVRDLGLGPLRIQAREPPGQFRLDRHDRQRVTEDVMQIAGELMALLGQGEPGDLVPGLDQLGVALDDVAHAPRGQGGNQDLEGHRPVPPSSPRAHGTMSETATNTLTAAQPARVGSTNTAITPT